MSLKPVSPSVKLVKKRKSELFEQKFFHVLPGVWRGLKILKAARFASAHHVINFSSLIGLFRCTGCP